MCSYGPGSSRAWTHQTSGREAEKKHHSLGPFTFPSYGMSRQEASLCTSSAQTQHEVFWIRYRGATRIHGRTNNWKLSAKLASGEFEGGINVRRTTTIKGQMKTKKRPADRYQLIFNWSGVFFCFFLKANQKLLLASWKKTTTIYQWTRFVFLLLSLLPQCCYFQDMWGSRQG